MGIPGPVFVESSQLHGALLGVPLVGIPATIDAVVKSDPYNPYAAAIQSTPAIKHIPVQAKKRLLLLDEDVRVSNTMTNVLCQFLFLRLKKDKHLQLTTDKSLRTS